MGRRGLAREKRDVMISVTITARDKRLVDAIADQEDRPVSHVVSLAIRTLADQMKITVEEDTNDEQGNR